MYAIFEDGSRQYRVAVGDTVRIDHREAEVGSSLEFGNVLLVATGTDRPDRSAAACRGQGRCRGDRPPVHQACDPALPAAEELPPAEGPSAAVPRGADQAHRLGLSPSFSPSQS